jgi:hypothetical protein
MSASPERTTTYVTSVPLVLFTTAPAGALVSQT